MLCVCTFLSRWYSVAWATFWDKLLGHDTGRRCRPQQADRETFENWWHQKAKRRWPEVMLLLWELIAANNVIDWKKDVSNRKLGGNWVFLLRWKISRAISRPCEQTESETYLGIDRSRCSDANLRSDVFKIAPLDAIRVVVQAIDGHFLERVENDRLICRTT